MTGLLTAGLALIGLVLSRRPGAWPSVSDQRSVVDAG
jgi:hypothetical protein